jgi:RecA-family ATPase
MSIAEEDFKSTQHTDLFLNISDWDSKPVPIRPWAVHDRIPLRQPTLLSGEGAAGKTLLALQLAVAHVLGRDWLGTTPEPGPVIYLGAEDEADELHRRLADILRHYGATFADVDGQLHLKSLAGEDAILGQPDRGGIIRPTPLFTQLLEAGCDIKPKLIVLDTSADVYAGSEIDRSQVRQFVGQLRSMAIQSNSSVILNSHPSLTGINTGTGTSGSTGWHNSVRARMYLKPAETEKGDEPDPELRELQFMKNNYGPKGEKILLRWQNGVFVPAGSVAPLDKLAADQKADGIFLTILGKFNQQSRDVSAQPSKTYAPALFAKEPEAKGVNNRALEGAMSRLLDTNKIHVEEKGSPSRIRRRLVIGPKVHETGTP